MHPYRVLIGEVLHVLRLTAILTLLARICVERGFQMVVGPRPERLLARSARGFGVILASTVVGCSAEELLTLGRASRASSSSEAIDASPGGADDASMSSSPTSDSSPNQVSDPTVGIDAAAPGGGQTNTSEASAAVTASEPTDGETSTSRMPAFDAGPQSPTPLAFDTPVLVEELYSGSKDDNPTLTWDMLEIYFSSKRGDGATDLWHARRSSVDEPFSEPEFLADMSTPDFDTSPAIEGDGLTFWFSSAREDGLGALDIIRVTRATRQDAWGAPTVVTELNSEQDDIPRPTGAGGLVMPLGSRRGGETYITYFATRVSPDAPFSSVVPATELAPEGVLTADAFLTDDGLTILYTRGAPDEPADLYMARRATLSEPFSDVMPLDTLNTEADERDPWLSPDGKTLYFSSDRGGVLAIYRATLL